MDITEVNIKPELGVIMLNIDYKNIFRGKLFEEKIKVGKCYEIKKKYSFFYCDKDVNIDIGELNFEIKRTGLKFYLIQKIFLLKTIIDYIFWWCLVII